MFPCNSLYMHSDKSENSDQSLHLPPSALVFNIISLLFAKSICSKFSEENKIAIIWSTEHLVSKKQKV